MVSLVSSHERIRPMKLLINIGGGLDYPTGYPVRGKYGETIINGGLGALTGVQGPGNSFKSRFAKYQLLSALSRIIYSGNISTYTSFDTEQNTHEFALPVLYQRMENLRELDILNSEGGIWSITDMTKNLGDEWLVVLKKYLRDVKMKTKGIMLESPFLGRDGKTLLEFPLPTFGDIDSLTALRTTEIMALGDKFEIGASERNNEDMRQGKAKKQLIDSLSVECEACGHYVVMVAHIGTEVIQAQGPMTPRPSKQLQHMKAGVRTKGTSTSYNYLINNGWDITSSSLCLDDDKQPKFPKSTPSGRTSNKKILDTDLNELTITQIRGKAGMSGVTIHPIVSQNEGYLPELTEFNILLDYDNFGLAGSHTSRYLELYPEVKFTRKTVRTLIDTNPKFRRALNMTSEICQAFEHWRNIDPSYFCTMKQLYDDLKAIGYNWDVLYGTRGWYTFNNDKLPIPFLSSFDLLRMRVLEYIPYWMKDAEKASLKKIGEFTPQIHPDWVV